MRDEPTMFAWLPAVLWARWQTAMHEAGHAVISYRLGFYLGSVSLNSDNHRLGVSRGEGPWCTGARDEDYIRALYAGRAAECLVAPDLHPEGCLGDYEEADALLPFVSTDKATLEADAANLVAKHRAEIEAVADALFEEDTLDDDDQETIILSVEEGDDWRVWLAFRRQFRAGASDLSLPPSR